MTASVRTRRSGAVRPGAVLGLSLAVGILAACSGAAITSSSNTGPSPSASAAGGGGW
jgi:hypothetical protein